MWKMDQNEYKMDKDDHTAVGLPWIWIAILCMSLIHFIQAFVN